MTSLRPAVVEEVDIDGDVVSAIPSAAQVTVGFIGAVLEMSRTIEISDQHAGERCYGRTRKITRSRTALAARER
jgi:hypothetical protein